VVEARILSLKSSLEAVGILAQIMQNSGKGRFIGPLGRRGKVLGLTTDLSDML
jgi:hypothetical protein